MKAEDYRQACGGGGGMGRKEIEMRPQAKSLIKQLFAAHNPDFFNPFSASSKPPPGQEFNPPYEQQKLRSYRSLRRRLPQASRFSHPAKRSAPDPTQADTEKAAKPVRICTK